LPTGPETIFIGPVLSFGCGNWKQCSLPGKQPVFCERLRIITRCIQHHLDNAFDIAVGGHQSANIHSESPGNGKTNLIPVQLFTLDFTRFNHVFREGAEMGLRTLVNANASTLPRSLPCSRETRASGVARAFSSHVR